MTCYQSARLHRRRNCLLMVPSPVSFFVFAFACSRAPRWDGDTTEKSRHPQSVWRAPTLLAGRVARPPRRDGSLFVFADKPRFMRRTGWRKPVAGKRSCPRVPHFEFIVFVFVSLYSWFFFFATLSFVRFERPLARLAKLGELACVLLLFVGVFFLSHKRQFLFRRDCHFVSRIGLFPKQREVVRQSASPQAAEKK